MILLQKRLIAPYEVYKEFRSVEMKLRNGLVSTKKCSLLHQTRAVLVGDMISNSKVTTPKKTKSGLWADPWVVAMAKEKEAIVITGEQARNVSCFKNTAYASCTKLDAGPSLSL